MNQFQSEDMVDKITKLRELKHEVIIAKKELQEVCSHLFPTGETSRQMSIEADYCCICEKYL